MILLVLAVPRAVFSHGWGSVPKRLVLFLLFVPLALLLNTLHWLGFLLDELLFHSWRRQTPKSPVFIVGVPRSGTTFLHRTLAQDKRFTTTSTWEVILAPSVSEKYAWSLVLGMLSPLANGLRKLGGSFFTKMDSIHKLGINEAEEDFLFLLPLNACFILITLFPQQHRLWRISRFDASMPRWEKELIAGFYRACVQKHLYFQCRNNHEQKIYLAKNPSFTPFVQTLKTEFSDARFVVCLREPVFVVESQFRSLLPAFELLGNGRLPRGFAGACVSMLHFYYHHLYQHLLCMDNNTPVVNNQRLRHRLSHVIEEIYLYLDIDLSRDLLTSVGRVKTETPAGCVQQYSLSELELSYAQIEMRFQSVWPINVKAEVNTIESEQTRVNNPALRVVSRCDAESKPLRVAVVSDAAPHRNGVGAYYEDLEQHLTRDRGTLMVTFQPEIRDGRWRGGLALPLPGDATQKFVVPNPYGLWRRLRKFQPDIVIVPTPGLYGICGAILAKKVSAKVITGYHTWYEKLTELYWSHWQGWLTKGYFNVSNGILFKYGDYLVANSEFMIRTAEEAGAPAAEIVGTPVAFDFIHTPLKPWSGQLKNVFFAGRLAAEKNLDAILDAARKMPELQFSIAGDGPEKAKVENATRELNNLHYLGWMNREALLKSIDSHDILILPSHVESFGTVALEAMARRRLVLISRHCGIADWESLRGGLACIREDETLHQALVRIAAMDAPARLLIAGEARRAAVDLNDWSLNKWKQLLETNRPQELEINERLTQHPRRHAGYNRAG